MSIVGKLFAHRHPAGQADRDLAAELARLHDLQRAGILSAAEAKAIRAQLLAASAPRRAA
jgi:hypothetical protein